MSYSRYTSQPTPERQLYQELGVALFYALSGILSEEVSDCPALRHFLSSALELLGGSVVADKPDRCLQLAERIIQNSFLAEFLTPSFTPNVADTDTFVRMYEKIAFEIPEESSSLAFVMMSKVSLQRPLGDFLPRWEPNYIATLNSVESFILTVSFSADVCRRLADPLQANSAAALAHAGARVEGALSDWSHPVRRPRDGSQPTRPPSQPYGAQRLSRALFRDRLHPALVDGEAVARPGGLDASLEGDHDGRGHGG